MLTSPWAEAAVAPADSATLVKSAAASGWAARRRIHVEEAITDLLGCRAPCRPGTGLAPHQRAPAQLDVSVNPECTCQENSGGVRGRAGAPRRTVAWFQGLRRGTADKRWRGGGRGATTARKRRCDGGTRAHYSVVASR